MREILQPSPPEIYSEINGRNLEFYLGISDLRESDLDGKVILNLGAGGSDLQRDLLKRGVSPRKVISVDLAYDIRFNRTKGYSGFVPPQNGAVRGDMCQLGPCVPPESIDYCFAVWSLSFYLPPERQKLALTEIIRVLKPKGTAYIYPIFCHDPQKMREEGLIPDYEIFAGQFVPGNVRFAVFKSKSEVGCNFSTFKLEKQAEI